MAEKEPKRACTVYRDREPDDERHDELAKYLLVAWIATRLRVTLPTAKRNVEKALCEAGRLHPGPMWYHLCEYIEKLNAGYPPFDLEQMTRADEDNINQAESVEPMSWIH